MADKIGHKAGMEVTGYADRVETLEASTRSRISVASLRIAVPGLKVTISSWHAPVVVTFFAEMVTNDEGARSSKSQMTDRSSRGDCLGGRHNALGVDAVVAIKVGHRAGLSEMLDS